MTVFSISSPQTNQVKKPLPQDKVDQSTLSEMQVLIVKLNNLANSASLSMKSPDAQSSLANVKDTPVSVNHKLKQDIVNAVQADPEDSKHWALLASSLDSDDSVQFKDDHLDAKGCYGKALSLDSNMLTAWCGLAALLKPGTTISIGNFMMTAEQCVETAMKALQAQLNNDVDATASKVNTVSKKAGGNSNSLKANEAHLKELLMTGANSKQIAAQLFKVASLLLPNQLAQVGHCKHTEIECYTQALIHDSKLAKAWIGLSRVLEPRERIKINGHIYFQETCEKMADMIHKVPPHKLPDTVNQKDLNIYGFSSGDPRGLVRLGSEGYDSRKNIIDSLSNHCRDPHMLEEIGHELCSFEEASIGRGVSSVRNCYHTAIERGSIRAEPWVALSRLLQRGEGVIINGVHFSKADCIEKARSMIEA